MKNQTMFTMSLSLATGTLLSVSLLACASNPSKEVRDTRQERAGDIREHTADENEVYAKDQAAADASNVALDKDTAKLDTELGVKLDANDQRSVDAKAALTEARKAFRTDASARIERADAKLSAVVFAKAKPINQPAVANMRSQIVSLKTAVEKLDAIGDEKWFKAKTEVETNLVALEADVAKIGG